MFWAQVKMIRRLVHVSYSLAERDFLYTLKRACIHVAGLWISEFVCAGGGGGGGGWGGVGGGFGWALGGE